MRRALPLVLLLALAIAPAAHAASGTAPGAPGAAADWTPANKDGFGTATGTASKVWYTLADGELTEVYYPDLGTPAVRDLQLVVSDGRTFADAESDATTHRVRLLDRRSLTYQQVNTSRAYRIVKTYVTDPARNSLLIRVRVVSLTGHPLKVYVVYDPSLSNDGNDDSATTAGRDLLAHDAHAGSALVGRFSATSNGYLGTSDGLKDLRDNFRMDWRYADAPSGNVVQTARTTVTGLRGHRGTTLALGFGRTAGAARKAAHASFSRGFGRVRRAYARGWHRYLAGLRRVPAPARIYPTTYAVSAMVLAASEDKTYRGAYIASPTMPWAWGTGLENPSGAYHLVWSRDLYEIATALMADGDRAGARRALSYLFDRQQKPDGSFPQNSTVDGAPHWTNTQLDEVAFPLVLAWQLGRTEATTYARHVKPAADYLLAHGPVTPQERWENQSGYSPATIAAEIAGLVSAAQIARRDGDAVSAGKYLRAADAWQKHVQGWTATTNGPYSPRPYYLRLTKDGDPDAATAYNIGDSGPDNVDQRAVVDPSFLELVRLGVKPAADPVIRNTLSVVDAQLGVSTPNGELWHRYTSDGYGEQRDGAPWNVGFPAGSQTTIGRAWPIFAGERGEYEVADGQSAGGRLATMAATANAGFLIPEQVWDEHPPSGQPGFPRGEGTFSATPLAWSHAQFIRLAWSIAARRPVEQPAVVACRYVRRCR